VRRANDPIFASCVAGVAIVTGRGALSPAAHALFCVREGRVLSVATFGDTSPQGGG